MGGLTPAAARTAVRMAVRSPLVIAVDGERVPVSPTRLGMKAYVELAVAKARKARPGAKVPIPVTIHGDTVRAWVARMAEAATAPSATRGVQNLRPRLVPEPDRLRHRREPTVAAIVEALRANRRGPVAAVAELVRPSRVSLVLHVHGHHPP